MLDIQFIRDNKEKVVRAAKNKNNKIDVEAILILDGKRRDLMIEVQTLREERNKHSKTKPTQDAIKAGKEIKEKIHALEIKLKKVEDEFNRALITIPNIPSNDVPIGKDDSENVEIRKWGTPRKYDFVPLDHVELGESLDVIDIKRASKVSGSRFAYLKNELVLMEFALVQLSLSVLIKEGFSAVIPPTLIKKEITESLGYWHGADNEEYYWVNEENVEDKGLYLIGTAEHAVVPYFSNETLHEKDMPKRFVAFSSCFRREAGSYGKDVRGILRVHQFDKVEMVSFTTPEKGIEEHEYFLSLEEKLFQMLEIPYRVLRMCTGDLGFPAARKYDIEAWIPSQDKYREVTSTSTTTDFQSRRLNIKYSDGKNVGYAHIINGTAFAIGRTLIAIMENYQQKDGSIKVPKVLMSYVGFEKISLK